MYNRSNQVGVRAQGDPSAHWAIRLPSENPQRDRARRAFVVCEETRVDLQTNHFAKQFLIGLTILASAVRGLKK
jgi:hypothetical protein